jgi:4-coumarate--CoA ligase
MASYFPFSLLNSSTYVSFFVSDIAIKPNTLAWVPTLFSLLAPGLRPTLANSSYTPGELAHQLKDSGAGMIFVHPTLFPVVIKTFTLLEIPDDQACRRVVIWTKIV